MPCFHSHVPSVRNVRAVAIVPLCRSVRTIAVLFLQMNGKNRGIQVRYRKGPLSQRSAHAEQYVQTNTNTNPDLDPTGGTVLTLMLGYRSLYITWQ